MGGEAADEGKPTVKIGDVVIGLAGEFVEFMAGAGIADDGAKRALPRVGADRQPSRLVGPTPATVQQAVDDGFAQREEHVEPARLGQVGQRDPDVAFPRRLQDVDLGELIAAVRFPEQGPPTGYAGGRGADEDDEHIVLGPRGLPGKNAETTAGCRSWP